MTDHVHRWSEWAWAVGPYLARYCLLCRHGQMRHEDVLRMKRPGEMPERRRD